MADDQKPTGGPGLKVSTRQFAYMCDRDIRSIQLEIKEGFIPKEGKGQLNLIEAMRGHCAYMDHKLNEATKRNAGSEVLKARAAEIQQRIAQRDKTLVPLEEVYALVDWAIGVYRTGLNVVPARFTRDMEQRAKLEELIDGEGAKAHARLAKGVARIRAGGTLDEAAAEDDAGEVGVEEPDISADEPASRPAKPLARALHGPGRAGGSKRAA